MKIMKKIYMGVVLITTITILSIISCTQMNANRPEVKPTVETSDGELTKDNDNEYLKYREYSLEGCQYIAVGVGNSKWGSHKGNCTNPIHKK